MNVRESLTTLGIDGILPPVALSLSPSLPPPFSLSYVISVLFSSSSSVPRVIHSTLQIFSWLFNTYTESLITKVDENENYNDLGGGYPKFVDDVKDLKVETLEEKNEFLQIVFDQPCKDWYDNEKKTQTPLSWEVCKKPLLIYVLDI